MIMQLTETGTWNETRTNVSYLEKAVAHDRNAGHFAYKLQLSPHVWVYVYWNSIYLNCRCLSYTLEGRDSKCVHISRVVTNSPMYPLLQIEIRLNSSSDKNCSFGCIYSIEGCLERAQLNTAAQQYFTLTSINHHTDILFSISYSSLL